MNILTQEEHGRILRWHGVRRDLFHMPQKFMNKRQAGSHGPYIRTELVFEFAKWEEKFVKLYIAIVDMILLNL